KSVFACEIIKIGVVLVPSSGIISVAVPERILRRRDISRCRPLRGNTRCFRRVYFANAHFSCAYAAWIFSGVSSTYSSITACFLQRKPDLKKLALANRSGFGDKAAANGGGIWQNNSDRRRRARRCRSSHAQFAQGGFHHIDGPRWRCWTAQGSDAKSRLYYSRSNVAENAWLGNLQDSEKRSR